MPTQIADLLDAMADQIEDQLGAVVETYRSRSIGRMVNSPTPPTIDMYPGDLSRGTDAAAFGTEGEFLFTVRARVERERRGRQPGSAAGVHGRRTTRWASPLALLDDTTLGGLATSLDCIDPTGYVTYPFGGSVADRVPVHMQGDPGRLVSTTTDTTTISLETSCVYDSCELFAPRCSSSCRRAGTTGAACCRSRKICTSGSRRTAPPANASAER